MKGKEWIGERERERERKRSAFRKETSGNLKKMESSHCVKCGP